MTPPPKPPPGLPPTDRYRPLTRRQRLRLVALTVLTVMALWLLLLYRPGGNPYRYVNAASAPGASSSPTPCVPGRQAGCPGGPVSVQLLPPAPPASAAAGP